MNKEKLLYNLCYYSHVFFYCSFWGYLGVLIIIHLIGFKLNIYLGYIFFLLLGLWIGSATALAAMKFMKKIHEKENKTFK